ncbi:MAG TPA: hypothetical protein VGC74_18105 [Stenotrophomonas sp.]|jgi:hypothetical protein
MKIITAIALTTALALFSTSVAAEEIVNCDGCTPLEMFNAGEKVVTRPAWNKPHPSVYVTNIPGNSVMHLAYANNVDQNFDWENDIFEAWAVNTSVDPTIVQLIANLNSILGSNFTVYYPASSAATARAFTTNSEDDGPGSVYDVMASSAKEQRVSNWLTEGWTGANQGAINSINQVAPTKGFFPQLLTWTITVNFPDGSVAKYAWDTGTGAFKRVPKTARDAEGNLIPETLADVAAGGYQEYIFGSGGGSTFADFYDRLTHMGVPVSSAGGAGTRVKIACVTSGGTTVCEIRQY